MYLLKWACFSLKPRPYVTKIYIFFSKKKVYAKTYAITTVTSSGEEVNNRETPSDIASAPHWGKKINQNALKLYTYVTLRYTYD